MKKIFIVSLAVFGLSMNKSTIAQTIATDRPDQTESSSTLPSGAFQIESGILIEEFDEGIHRREISHPTTLFRFGLFGFMELRAVHSYNSRTIESSFSKKKWKNSGMADIELGSKIQILDQADVNTQIAFLSHLILPTGSAEFSENIYASTNRFLFSHAFENFDLSYNVGFDYADSEDYQFIYTLAIAHAINHNFSFFIETFGEINENNEHLSNIDGGFAFLINDLTQVDFAFGTGINHAMNYLTVGFSTLILAEEKE